jgi:hypothetical protein
MQPRGRKMSYKIYAKETLNFELDENKFEMDVIRMPMREAMRFGLKGTRIQTDIESKDPEVSERAFVESFELQADMLATVIEDLRGIEDLEQWPKEHNDRVDILCHNSNFLVAVMGCYNKYKEADEEKEGK